MTTSQVDIEEIQDILNVLGPGLCDQCGCEGCKYEVNEAIDSLAIIIAKAKGKECKTCKGRRWQDKPRDPNEKVPFFEPCPTCKGTGLEKDFWPLEDYYEGDYVDKMREIWQKRNA